MAGSHAGDFSMLFITASEKPGFGESITLIPDSVPSVYTVKPIRTLPLFPASYSSGG